MYVALPVETAQSASWKGPAAAVAVVVSSHGRAELLGGLLDALEAQTHADFEVVVTDNASADETWEVLRARCADTRLRLRALRVSFHDGPGIPRNTGISESRAPILAFTDDDCLPTPTWLTELAAAFDDPTTLVQGRTVPEPGGWAGPWGRSLDVSRPSGLYETANLAARRDAILRAGGFDPERLLSGRAFGEDVVLGATVARSGGFRFAADAVVHHRVMPRSYADFLAERRRLAGFPQLLRKVPELRRRGFAWLFLSRRTAITDLAAAGVVTAIVLGSMSQPLGLLALLGAIPWTLTLWRESALRPDRLRAVRALQLAVADLVGLAALIRGDLQARRLLL